MKNKRILLPVIILAVVTIILAVINITGAPVVVQGDVLIVAKNKETTISLKADDLQPIIGTLVNGKGDQIPVDGTGISLQDVLALAEITDFETVTATARDEYSAEVTGEEIQEASKCYLLVEADGSIRLVVFGDSNSKRNVTDVIRLTVS